MLPAPAFCETDLWSFVDPPDRTEIYLSNCIGTDTYTEGCLRFACNGPEGPSLTVLTSTSTRVSRSPAVFALDGVDVMAATLSMQTHPEMGDSYITPMPLETLSGFLDRITGARALSIRFEVTSLNRPDFEPTDLQGIAAPLASFRSRCAADPVSTPQPAVGAIARNPEVLPKTGPNPETDPARFIPVETISLRDAAVLAEARRLTATAIAEAEAQSGETIDVFADLVPFQDGRQLLFVSHCHPTWYGISGCETWLFGAGPGEALRQFFDPMIGGGPYWLDLGSAHEGWPDLVSLPPSAQGDYVRNSLAP